MSLEDFANGGIEREVRKLDADIPIRQLGGNVTS